MDPSQYYEFALGVLQGRESFDGFEVPSIFPFLVLPILALDAGIASSMWIHVVATVLLLASVHGLCRECGVETPSPVVALLILSSPLLLGLSRTLYVEYTLTALVSFCFLLWLRFAKAPGIGSGLAFGCALAVGFLTKMTFPLFFLLPVAAAVLSHLREGRRREAALLAQASVVPTLLVALIGVGVFPGSLGYYLSLGNTTVPIMALIGPPEWWSLSSITYYAGEIGRTLLFLLTPFLLLAVAVSWRRRGALRTADWATPRAALWLWAIGPLVLLILQPVKEPRHVAPCVVPAILLSVLAIESLSSRGLRRGALALALALAVLQAAAVTSGWRETPYFLDRALHWDEIRDRMAASDAPTKPASAGPQWLFRQNVALEGFPPNEALALTWQLFPAVVFDLETLDDPGRISDRTAYERFEDLYILTAFNTYNRRSGWRHYYETLSREQALANAGFVLARGGNPAALAKRHPDHALVASVERGDDVVHVLRSERPTTPYRTLYAREFLRRNPDRRDDETLVVAKELLLTAVLGGREREARALVREFPALRSPGAAPRNIYWIAGYGALLDLAR